MYRRNFCKSALSAVVAGLLPSRAILAALQSTPAVQSDIEALTVDGGEITIAKAAVAEFAADLDGALILPGDDRYETLRHVWNGMIDKHPAMIALCASDADVARAVQFAADRQLRLAVKGGGHSFPGKSVCDDGLVIDLSAMQAVAVDAESRTARVQGGALLGQLDGATLAHELVTTTGVVSHTGVGGFTLGGGMGRTDRVTGLAVDNVLGATLATADGQVRKLGPDLHPDLFWAIRGGGGNFGVVTEFVYRLHPFDPMIYGGSKYYPWSQVRDVLSYWAEINDSLPDGASVEPQFYVNADGERELELQLYFTGPHAEGERVFAKFNDAGRASSSDLGLKSYREVQTMWDVPLGHGQLNYLKSGLLPALTEEVIDTIVRTYEGDDLPLMFFQHLGGASARIDPTATAYPHRKVHSNFGIGGAWQDPAETDRRIARIREIHAALKPWMQGFYANLNEDTASNTQSNYGVNYERLVGIKNRYDSTNLFRLNANIVPTV